MKRSLAIGASAVVLSSVALVGLPGSAGASVVRYQLGTYTYSSVNYYLGSGGTAYPQTGVITVNPCNGTVSGTGTANPGVWENSTITGFYTGPNTVEFFVSYPVGLQTNYMVTVLATFNPDGSFSGTWSDNYSPGPQSGIVTSVAPVSVSFSSYANHGQYVKAMGGGEDAAHSCIGMPIQSQS
jgi:hypothetical protein